MATETLIRGSTGTVEVNILVDSSGRIISGGGEVASGAADSGNPMKVGAVYNLTPGSVDSGDRVDLQADLKGSLRVINMSSDTTTPISSNSFADAASMGTGLSVRAAPMEFNGATFDRRRNNSDVTVFTSTARTATPTPFDATNYNGRGLHLVIDATAASATPSVVFTIQGKDALSGQFYTLLTSAAITGISTTILRVYPGLTAAANLVASDILPRTWRVIATHGDADSITYSVGASVIL